MKHHNIVITIICEVHKTNFCPPYVKKFVNFHVGYAVIILWSTLWKMTVTQKHIAPLHPRFPTWDENCFCRTTLERWGLKRWGFKTSGCKNVSLTRFHTTLSSVERKRLFPCIPGCMCASLIFSFTLSVRVTPFTHLLEETDMLLSQSLQVWAYFHSIFVNLFVYHFEITGRNF